MQIYLLMLACILLAPTHAQKIVTVTVAQPAPTTSPCYTSSDVFQDIMLNITNKYRDEHNASFLSWNNTLARSAYDWAKQCRWRHSNGASGENLAMGYPNVTGAVEAWGDEREKFNFYSPGFHHDTGHFTQLVWKATRSVGCGRFDCGRQHRDGDDERALDWYIVCHYHPRGNVVGGDFFGVNIQSPRSDIPINSGASRSKSYVHWSVHVVTLLAMFIAATGSI